MMSFKDQFNQKNNNKLKQNNKNERSPLRTNPPNVEFAEEAAREAGLDLEVYKQNKPQ